MLDWIASVMETLGYAGVAFLMFLENVFPPIPSELIMPLAGFSAARTELSLWWMIVAGTLGSVAGQYPLYYLGKKLGKERLVRWADRHGKWFTLSGRDIERASDWFEKRGPWTVALCRLVPGLRSFISIPAGINRMNLGLFTLYSIGGIAIWSAALAVAGYLLGDNYDKVESALGPVTWIVVGLLVAGALVFMGRRSWRCHKDAAACRVEEERQAALEDEPAHDERSSPAEPSLGRHRSGWRPSPTGSTST